MAEPRIKYDIAANVSGDAEVDQLADKLEGLARTLDGDVKASALASAQALRELSARQGAIDNFARLKTEAQDAGRRLEEMQAAAQKMGRELAAVENPTRAQAGQMQRLRDAVRVAKQEVTEQTAAVQRARASLQAYGIDTGNLSAKEQAIRQAIAQARGEVERIVPAYQRTAQAATAAGSAQERGALQGAAGVQRLSDQVRTLEGLARTLQGTMAAAGIGVGLAEIKDAADTFANLQARIRLVTGEGEAFESAWQGVLDVAQRTNADLEATGTLFQRIAQSGRDAGLSVQQATAQSLALTETIGQALAVSGGSADASRAAITQLIQGLQSGVLRGEEFNSVMEQAPRLARALADGLGVTTGELRKMAQAGTLTTATVIGALQGQAAVLREEFEQLPPTIGRALQNLKNNWTAYIGEASKANGTSIAAARALALLSENIDSVAGFLLDLGKAAAAFKLIDLATTLNAKAAAAANAARAIQTETTATIASTAATRANSIEAERNALAKQGAAAATLANAQAAERATASQLTVGQAFRSTAAAATGALARLAGFATGVGAAWLAVDVGGDILKSAGTAIGESIARLMGYRDATKELAEAERQWQEAARDGEQLRARQNALNLEARERAFELSKANRETIAEFDGLIAKGNSASEAIAKIGKDFDLASVPGIRDAGAVLDKLQADARISAEQFRDAWADALKSADLGVFEANARAAFAGSAREAERLAAVLDGTAREAIRRAGLDFDLIAGGMGRASRSAINDTEAIITSLDRLKDQGVDTGRALVASISKSLETADSKAAVEAVRAQIEQLRKVLGDKVADGLLDQARDKLIALKDAADDAAPGIDSLREAFRTLGLQAPEDLKRIAATNRQAWETIRQDSTVASDQLKRAFEVYAQSAIAAAGAVGTESRAVTEALLQGEAAAKGLAVSFDEAGRAIVKGAFEGAKAIDGVTESTRKAERAQRDLNAAQEDSIELRKREAEIERKNREEARTVRDTAGNTVNMGGATLMSIVNQLKGYGLDDEAALRIGREFTDRKGDVPYFSNPGQLKYGKKSESGGTFDTLEMAVQRAAEKELYGGGNAIGQKRTVEVNIGGRTHSIGVASEADSEAAVAMLRALEQEANRSAL